MNDSGFKTGAAIILAFICIGLVAAAISVGEVVVGNKVGYAVQKADDATNYETLKRVEDTARAMISSYEADKQVYLQFSSSEEKEQRSWGQAAKAKANRTAATYNNYILENSFIWKGNTPDDISEELEYLE